MEGRIADRALIGRLRLPSLKKARRFIPSGPSSEQSTNRSGVSIRLVSAELALLNSATFHRLGVVSGAAVGHVAATIFTDSTLSIGVAAVAPPAPAVAGLTVPVIST